MSLAACIIRWPCTTRSPGWRYLLFGRWSSRTERVASFTWRNSGSCWSRPCSSAMNERVPTLPTPTTLRATSTSWNRSSRWRRSSCKRRAVAAELLAQQVFDLVDGIPAVGGHLAQRDHDRRLADDLVPAVDELGELREGLQAVVRARLVGDAAARASPPTSPRASVGPFQRTRRGARWRSSGRLRTGASTRCPSWSSARTPPSAGGTTPPIGAWRCGRRPA